MGFLVSEAFYRNIELPNRFTASKSHLAAESGNSICEQMFQKRWLTRRLSGRTSRLGLTGKEFDQAGREVANTCRRRATRRVNHKGNHFP